ncbi:MAG: hypothetical protein GXP09_00020 [Gammaproteobacteria bacterium]|nr:hypothetical protein [Gammaproteobacteria bacterium]
MCIIIVDGKEVVEEFVVEVEVSNTNIFARSLANGRQALVYSMTIRPDNEAAMILPLPVPPDGDENNLDFIDLSAYPTFFDDMKQAIPTIMMVSFGDDEDLQPAMLKVHEVGDYEASFVPSTHNWDRLDPRFRLPENVWAAMPDYHDYGFAVFQLKPKFNNDNIAQAETIHPMAFIFKRRDPDIIFYPTVHVHDKQYHAMARFDHRLFCQCTEGELKRIHKQAKALAKNNAMCVDTVDEHLDDWVLNPQEMDEAPEGVWGVGYAAKDVMDVGRAQGLVDGEKLILYRTIRGEHLNQDSVV